MLSGDLDLELKGLSTLQRKILTELVQRKHPQLWSRFTNSKYSWKNQKGSLEEFIQNHDWKQSPRQAFRRWRRNSGHNGVCRPVRSGKTQLCLMLCVTAQLPPELGGLGGNVLYFDTEGTFSSNRVYQIAAENGFDPGQTLHNIILSRVYTSDHQMFLLDNAFEKCAEENVKLVVVDSVISHFRGEFLGRETLADRQQKLNLYMHKLLRLAEILNLAVVVTNQAQSDPTPQWGRPTSRQAGWREHPSSCIHYEGLA